MAERIHWAAALEIHECGGSLQISTSALLLAYLEQRYYKVMLRLLNRAGTKCIQRHLFKKINILKWSF